MPVPTRWDPFRDIRRFDPFAGFEEVFRDDLSGRGAPAREGVREGEYERVPEPELRTDVSGDDEAYYVQIEIPGVAKNDIDVAVEGNRVTISAEARREPLRAGEQALYRERYVGKAGRIFTLPDEIDSDRSAAVYEGGVLNLTLPKRHEGASRHLSIRRRIPWRLA